MEVTIIGTGVMGKGIAIELLKYGFKVNLVSTLRKFNSTIIFEEIIYLIQKQKFFQTDITNRLNITQSLECIKDSKLIIEAISEDLNLKRDLVSKIIKFLQNDAIIATNSSSLTSIQIFKDLNIINRAINLHFFNPVHKIELVEISIPDYVDSDIKLFILEFLKIIKKTPVFINNYPGMIVNKLLVPMIGNAISLYESGAATKEDTDTAIKLGLKHPMGPLELSDFIGNDIVLKILYNLREHETEIVIPKTLIEMVSENKLGRKTKLGFYNYL